ncbi:hypothetical protein MC7420_2951 [Coleofasciculus chthonoplastes PCC 7420]|uniref:Uncharacterized protein n=1 Tax=Coleofasciculus chthonoplastes PCC 7420 TaxID=118168 RepID=B4VJV4_9CYAN|nr:hypothetical protein MC7420_2951 [Coleofasciculus chthonoplastes PCC 7420]
MVSIDPTATIDIANLLNQLMNSKIYSTNYGYFFRNILFVFSF